LINIQTNTRKKVGGETEEIMVKVAACQPMTSKPAAKHRMPPVSCRQHYMVNCPQCLNIPAPAHQCQALIAICQKCGQNHSVIADAYQFQDKLKRTPVTEGTIEGKTASVLRDTGCSTVVVRRSLVSDDKLTDQEKTCILIDKTFRKTSVAEVHIETFYFSGKVTTLCIKNRFTI